MLYRRPQRWRVLNLWVRVMLANRRRRAAQDIRDLSPYLKRDLGLMD